MDLSATIRNTPHILELLLKDQTLCASGQSSNIRWATEEYPFSAEQQIGTEKIKEYVQPRMMKHIDLQTARSKNYAEVFTPAWLCNAQNNLVDDAWFGRKDVFNKEVTLNDGTHSWHTTQEHIVFTNGRTWQQYIKAPRLEMACGEAPYICSRYDATTGEAIALTNRIGIADRKFRVLLENSPQQPTPYNKRRFLLKAYQVLQSVYGFDWQGDNVFLARESLLLTFCEYYHHQWKRRPSLTSIQKAAEIISWNIWQMDGTRFTIPYTNTLATIKEWHGAELTKGKTIVFKDLI